jgi:glycerol-3-phosphate dehydrogenase (NAD(P)+)
MSELKKIGVIGSGAWGTALAQVFAQKGYDVVLWGRSAQIVAAINTRHVNDAHLPDVTLSEKIKATTDMGIAAKSDVLVLVTPTQSLSDIAEELAGKIKAGVPILIASKGVEIASLRLPSQIIAGALPENPVGVLTGPSFAIEVARGLPAALTLAMAEQHRDTAYYLCEALGAPHFRLYVGDDMIGAQIGGAIKNVIAIACGIAQGRKMGDNARAAIITRGLAEMVRLGAVMGADPQTFLGLSGIGDLTLTCNALQSRNFSLGVAVGEGRRARDVIAERSSIAEGYYTAEAAVKLAESLDVEMPICSAVYETLHKEKAIDYVIKGLLGRAAGAER